VASRRRGHYQAIIDILGAYVRRSSLPHSSRRARRSSRDGPDHGVEKERARAAPHTGEGLPRREEL